MSEVSELVRMLLARRGVVEDADIEKFLAPDYERDLHDPMLLADMDVALALIFDALDKNERIAIYADYDCDGIPGGALLSQLFKRIGYGNMEVYVPHRDREGYGVHTHAIDALAARGVQLIITVDVGIVAFEAAAHAKEIGIDMIITDHHEMKPSETGVREPGYELPDALAVINPKRAGYPFPDLCGAGTAFKLACAILAEGRRRAASLASSSASLRGPGDSVNVQPSTPPSPLSPRLAAEAREKPRNFFSSFADIPLGWEKWLLDLAAIATIADMVPLVGENRAIAHFGLKVLRKTPRPGLRTLSLSARFNLAQADEETVGFSIAPRVNAASRMDEPELAFRLLTTTNDEEASALASQLESLNTKRKAVVASITKEARRRVRDRFTSEDTVVVLGDPAWKPALLGLSANTIVEDRGGVAFLWGRDAQGNIKGSCRSDGSVSVVELMHAAREQFVEFGGHHASGGFSLTRDSVHTLPEALAAAAHNLVHATPDGAHAEAPAHDMELPLSRITWSVFEELSHASPFGIGNPKPVFRIARVVSSQVSRFGKEKNHTEVQLVCRDTSARVRAFDFFVSPESFTHTPAEGSEVDVLATIERDAFRGPARLALRLVDILPSRG